MPRKTSFYYSFLVLPARERRAIIAVWDFCRAVDDSVDDARPTAGGVPSGREAVLFWRAELARCYDGIQPATVQGQRLQPHVTSFDLPRAPFDDVIDGVAMDLQTTRYATFDDLLEYCRRVASAVGLICIKIFGCRSPQARDYAVNLGIALQLTNILRDIKDDLRRGRVYLPLEDFRAFGCRVDDLRADTPSEGVRQLIDFECRRAHQFYQRALDVLPPEDRRRLLASEIMRAVYFETLKRIERSGDEVFTARMRLARPRQALIALRLWLWPS